MSELSLRSNSCIELSEIRKLDSLLKQCESVSHEDISYETEQFQLYDYLENKRKYSSTGLLSILTNGKLHRFCIDKPLSEKLTQSSCLKSNTNMSTKLVTIPPPGQATNQAGSLNWLPREGKGVKGAADDEFTEFKRASSANTSTKPALSHAAATTKRRKVHNYDSLDGTTAPHSQSDDNQQSDWKSHYHDEEEERRIRIRDIPSQIITLDRSDYRSCDTRSDRSDKSLSHINSMKSRSKFSPTFLSRKASHKSETANDTTARESLLPAKLDLKLREPVETVRISLK